MNFQVFTSIRSSSVNHETNKISTAKGQYPHIYSNSDGVQFSQTCVSAPDSDVWTNFYEFPILQDGSILEAGRSSRTDVGTDRVVFQLSADAGFTSYIYCGVITHFTDVLRPAIIDGIQKYVLPFKLC
jgi:hypothetical protein